ncbi:MAG: ferrous iron transport protein A [Verrucomicrobiales bacterium]|jgi:Fe2+ transport system protein FeoA
MTSTLSNLPVGHAARVKSFENCSATDQRLMVMGLIPGVRVRKVQVAPLGDPIAIEFEGRCVSLRLKEALSVLLESA